LANIENIKLKPLFLLSSVCGHYRVYSCSSVVIYNCAYLIYNISMVVKDKESPIERIRSLLRDQNGLLFTSDLVKRDIPRTYLSILEKKGEVQRISRGVYLSLDSTIDEMVGLQARYKAMTFSHETAAYLLDLSDRTPLFYSVTVPTGYNATSLRANGAKVFFMKRELYPLGSTTIKSPHGNNIRAFNLERTICDLLRSRNRVDIQLVNDALKRYVKKKEKDLDLLYNYAKQFGIQRIVRDTIEVLL
jgi:predicted transcriptional regulator of viral defense system